MNKLCTYSILLAVFTLQLYSCKKASFDLNNSDSSNSYQLYSDFFGQVIDEQGNPIEGAQVRIGNHTFYTGSNGIYNFSKIITYQKSVIQVQKQNYYTGYKTLFVTDGQDNYSKIRIIEMKNPTIINSSANSDVTLLDGGKISFQANSFVNKITGVTFNGPVTVYANWIDPNSEYLDEVTPGSLMAINSTNEERLLQTFGMIGVEIFDNSNQPLQIADGFKAGITFPIPNNLLSQAPQSIPLWYFDTETGMWKEEGSATLNGNSYTGDVKHFSFWNCDKPINFVQLKATFKNNQDVPIVNAMVRITDLSNNDARVCYTNSNGFVGGAVPKNSSLKIEVIDLYCNFTIHTQNISSNNIDINLGTIIAEIPSTQSATIIGTIKDCNYNSCANSLVILTINNHMKILKPSTNGNFAFNAVLCNSPSIIQLVAQNATDMVFGEYTYTVSSGVNNLGNISACGQSLSQFVSWTSNANGIISQYTITDPMGIFEAGIDPLVKNGFASGDTAQNITCGISFDGLTSSQGNHYLTRYEDHLDIDTNLEITNSFLSSQIPVYLTSYGGVGGVIEGNFKGTILGLNIPSRTVSCYFRLKRTK